MTTITNSSWAIDPSHSQVQFKVKHLAISNVSGTFQIFNGTVLALNDDFTDAEIKFEIDSNSISTNNSKRDEDLKSKLFLDSEKFPKITFVGLYRNQNGNESIDGDLTLLNTTKKVKLDAEYTGIGTGRFGDVRAGFEVKGKINRKDFGLEFGLLTEAGSLVVGEEIKLHFDIQLIKKP